MPSDITALDELCELPTETEISRWARLNPDRIKAFKECVFQRQDNEPWFTALSRALEADNVAVVEWFIARKIADPRKERETESPHLGACRSVQMINVLIEAGASLTAPDDAGKTHVII
jgi:hypothetical protein